MLMVFWVVTACGLLGRYDVSKEHISVSPEDEGSLFFRNADIYLKYTACFNTKDRHRLDYLVYKYAKIN
jgi:hypothetical protein